jgi:TPR repeat protein
MDEGCSELVPRTTIWPLKHHTAGDQRRTSYANAISLSLVHLMRCESIRTITDVGRRNSDMLARWISECDQIRGTNTGNPLSAMIFAILSWTCEDSPSLPLPMGFPAFPPALPPLPPGIPPNLRIRLVQCPVGFKTLPKEVALAVELGLQPIIILNMYESLHSKLLKRIQSSVLNVQLDETDFGANRQIVEESMSGPMQGMVFALAHLEHQTFPGVKCLCDRNTFSVTDLSILDPCRRGIQFLWVDVVGLAEVVKRRTEQSSMLQNLGIFRQKSDNYAIMLRDNKVATVEELEAYGAKSIPALVSFLQNKIGMNQKEVSAIKLHIEQKIQYVQQLNLFVECLKPVPLFKENTAEEILDIARLALCESFKEKQPIVRQGEPGRLFYIILEGHATVHIKGVGQVADLGPKKFFGEVALLKDVPRTATVIAHNNGPIKCKCMTIEREAFTKARLVAAENASRKVMVAKAQKRQNELLSNFRGDGPTIQALLQYRDLGAFYTGTVNIHGNEHGYGCMTTDCGFSYDGLWLDGLPHGSGRFVSSNLSDQCDREWTRGFPDDAASLFDACIAEDTLCPASLYHYALCYMHGHGVQKNQSRAMDILQKLHALGHCDSSFLVACSIESSENDDSLDLPAAQARAFKIFSSTAQKGHVPSQLRAALCLDAGRGVLKNEKEAFALLLPLASHGHPVAQYHIGVYYECGFGVSPDYAKCMRWLKWSSQQGHFPATRRLSVVNALYPEGNAVWPEDDD